MAPIAYPSERYERIRKARSRLLSWVLQHNGTNPLWRSVYGKYIDLTEALDVARNTYKRAQLTEWLMGAAPMA